MNERRRDLHRYLRFAICNLWSFVVWPSFISLYRTNSNDLTRVFHSIPCANERRFHWPFPCDLLIRPCVSVIYHYKRKVQAKKRVNSMHEPRINARESSAYYSLPYYRAIFYSTAILCLICYVYKMQMCNLPYTHRELRCIPTKWKMVTNSSLSIDFCALFGVSRLGLHGTSFYFCALEFVHEKRQHNDIFRIQAVFNYFAIAMPVAIIWQKHWFCDSILSRFFSSFSFVVLIVERWSSFTGHNKWSI